VNINSNHFSLNPIYRFECFFIMVWFTY